MCRLTLALTLHHIIRAGSEDGERVCVCVRERQRPIVCCARLRRGTRVRRECAVLARVWSLATSLMRLKVLRLRESAKFKNTSPSSSIGTERTDTRERQIMQAGYKLGTAVQATAVLESRTYS